MATRTRKTKAAKPVIKFVRARYDAASTTTDNARHWSMADYLSADAEADAGVRRILRARARYECANNSYAKGIVHTLANDCIGTGPRLQMLTPDEELNKNVERDFIKWARAIRLSCKLRTMRKAQCKDGEAFAMLVQNGNLRCKPDIRLDIQLVEADRVTDDEFSSDSRSVDGVTFDRYGNPKSYRVLLRHPGDDSGDGKAITVPAENMIHIFSEDRPGQHRGVPEILPSLPLFAQLRRYTLAVLAASEAAADFSGILYTDAPADGSADNIEPMDTIQLERNMLMTMPGGWKMSQVDAKQPSSTYSEFKHEILNEIARSVNMPYNVAAGNSSGYNYASGRLDHQTYHKAIKIDRDAYELIVLDPIFEMWFREWSLLKGISAEDTQHTWFWDGFEHVDPSKEANSQMIRLQNNTTSLAAEYAKVGKDWEVEVRQIARERQLTDELGITPLQTGGSQKDNEDED